MLANRATLPSVLVRRLRLGMHAPSRCADCHLLLGLNTLKFHEDGDADMSCTCTLQQAATGGTWFLWAASATPFCLHRTPPCWQRSSTLSGGELIGPGCALRPHCSVVMLPCWPLCVT